MVLCGVCGEFEATLKSEEDHEEVFCSEYCCSLVYTEQDIVTIGVSSAKAREILRHGSVHGRSLSPSQRRYFGWVAGGKKKRKRKRRRRKK